MSTPIALTLAFLLGILVAEIVRGRHANLTVVSIILLIMLSTVVASLVL